MAKTGSPRIFVAVAAQAVETMEDIVARASLSQVGHEFRLDYLVDHSNLEARLRDMMSRLHLPATIATCRRSEAGGLFKGTVQEQLIILQAALRAGFHWVDIEIESVERAGAGILGALPATNVIVSYHNFRQTPDLGPVYRKLARLPVQTVKIATYARTLEDNLRISRLVKAKAARRPRLVAFGLGASGIPSRLLALKWGCPFTYAAVNGHSAVAPGQLAAEALRSIYRVEHLPAHTQVYGVVGTRASTSLSPSMQNAAFHAKRVKAIYLPCETKRLADFLKFARALNFSGFSVTMPFKTAILRELDWVEPLAARIGACNTVAVQRGKWTGWNTDAAAVVEVLTKRLRLAGSRILILGAGGAARAASYALRAEGAQVVIAARREPTARRLAKATSAQVVPWGAAEALDVDAVINATPVGMAPYSDAVPVDLARLRTRVVFDLVYHPEATRLVLEARGRGLTTISGLEMLVAQGARQFEIWTGQSAPHALMEQAVRQAL